MNKLKVNQMFDSVQSYFDNESHKNPLTYLIAKSGQTFYSNDKIAPKTEGNDLLEEYFKKFFKNLKDYIDEFGIYDWDSECPETGILTKKFSQREQNFYKNISSFDAINRKDFLKKLYELRYFNLELRLNDNQSIHLHQHLSSGYDTSWKLHVKLFEDEIEKINVIDYTKSFTIGQDFDFIGYVDKKQPEESFFVIQYQKWFEKLFDYIEQYRIAFDEVSKLSCLDLSKLDQGTEDCWRKCSSLLKYPHLKQCITALNNEILSDKQTISKDILRDKGIPYKVKNGKPILIPQGPNQFKAVVKILNDKIVRTHYLRRTGLSDYIEEL